MERPDATDDRDACFEDKVLGIVGTQPYVHWRGRRRLLVLDGHFSLQELRLMIAACEEVYGCGHEEGGCDCPH